MGILDILKPKKQATVSSNKGFHNKIRVRHENRGKAVGVERTKLQKSIKWSSSYADFKQSVDSALLQGLALGDVGSCEPEYKRNLEKYCQERDFSLTSSLGRGIARINDFIE